MMKRSALRVWLCGALIAAVLMFIWGNSLLPGEDSGDLSGFVGSVLQTLLPFLDLSSERGMHLLRKAAHFSEFAVLGFLLRWLWGMLCHKRLPALALPLVCGTCAAAIDETIQLFSPDRGPSMKDVGIGASGVLSGIVILSMFHFLYTSMKKR